MIKKNPVNEIRIPRPSGKTDRQAIAAALVGTPVPSAITVTSYLQPPFDDCLNELTVELAKQVKAVNDGDLSNVEGLLLAQAHTLNTTFNRLLQRANDQEYLENFETIFKLALRAQSQCARTLEVLSAIKNPPAFVKQANIAHNQQINNGTQSDPSPASQQPASQQPAIEHTHGTYLLDAGTPAATSGTNSATATVALLHRTKDRRRQG